MTFFSQKVKHVVYTTTAISILLLSDLFFAGCGRKDKTEPQEKAGKGGNAILKITTKHHGKIIDSATVYIKYNEQNTPASYDDSVKIAMVDGKPVAVFSELKPGNYYLLGLGWDSSIVSEVRGGIPYTIGEEKTYDISLPVTEGD